MNKIRKGDDVIVIKGKDRGKRGKVLRVTPKDLRALVEGVRLVKKHTKPNPQLNQPGGIVEKESFIPLSDIALYNPTTGKPDRAGIKILDDGRKVRYFKSNNELVDV